MKNEQYRIDRMLQAAAQRGVRINIIVYKEVRTSLILIATELALMVPRLLKHSLVSICRPPCPSISTPCSQDQLISSHLRW
jgi:phospholipase D1/2